MTSTGVLTVHFICTKGNSLNSMNLTDTASYLKNKKQDIKQEKNINTRAFQIHISESNIIKLHPNHSNLKIEETQPNF